MSKEALKVALQKEEAKLARQEENHEASKAVAEVLGDTAKEIKKRDKQIADMKVTRANIKKLQAAIGK